MTNGNKNKEKKKQVKGNVSQPRWRDRRHYSKHLQQEAKLEEVYSYERKEEKKKSGKRLGRG